MINEISLYYDARSKKHQIKKTKPNVTFVAEITIVIQVTRLKRKSTVNFVAEVTIVIDVTTVTIVKLTNLMCKVTRGTLLT